MIRRDEPLSIWFFVGMILVIYGIIVTGSGLVMEMPPTKLAELRPSLWWGGIMTGFGGLFTAIGWRASQAEG